MNALESAVFDWLSNHLADSKNLEFPDQPVQWVIAYSGGLDSSVLLHLVHKFASQSGLQSSGLQSSGQLPSTAAQSNSVDCAVKAIHINHGLQKDNDKWQSHCESVCQKLSVPLHVQSLSLAAQNQLSEDDARQARYQFFERYFEPVNEPPMAKNASNGRTNNYLIMGHHQDDQAETLLFRLFRGTGLVGMRGIPNQRTIGAATILRPLLAFNKSELLEYAHQNNIQWITDHTNDTNEYDRNYIRNAILPLVEKRWPKVVSRLTNFSTIAAKQVTLLKEVAKQDLMDIGASVDRLPLSCVANLSNPRLENLIYFWVQENANTSPQSAELQQLLDAIDLYFQNCSNPANVKDPNLEAIDLQQTGAKGLTAKFQLKVAGGWIRFFDHSLYFVKKSEPKRLRSNLVWKDIRQSINLGSIGYLTAKSCGDFSGEVNISLVMRPPKENEVVSIRPRQGGERVKPIGRNHSTELKKIYQECKVPPWRREWLPVIYYNDAVACVPGVFVDQAVISSSEDDGIVIGLDAKI